MDGEEHRLPTTHRSGWASAPQALASALAGAEVDEGSACVVLAHAFALPRSADPIFVSGDAPGFLRPSAPDETCTWFWGRLGSSPGGAA
jgi:hypothetical protein